MNKFTNEGATLTGPGIETQAHLSLPGIAPVRANGTLVLLGLDVFFCAGAR